jgi:hypothetical protein
VHYSWYFGITTGTTGTHNEQGVKKVDRFACSVLPRAYCHNTATTELNSLTPFIMSDVQDAPGASADEEVVPTEKSAELEAMKAAALEHMNAKEASERSLCTIEICPWEVSTDLDALYARIKVLTTGNLWVTKYMHLSLHTYHLPNIMRSLEGNCGQGRVNVVRKLQARRSCIWREENSLHGCHHKRCFNG